MDELSRKFRSIDWKGLQKSARRVQASTASALKDMVMTDLENKVRAATSDTSWGASGSDLMQIAQGTFSREDYALIMSIVWQRLGSSRWRCVYKALEVLRYLIMHGAARCAEEARAASHHIQTLQHYRYIDPKTRRDHGEGVRTRAKLVCDILADENLLEEEREKSRELRSKLQGGSSVGYGGRLGGLSSDDYQYGVGGVSSGEGYSTTSTGAGNFKGYGDDETDGGGYDDAPTGNFSKRVAGESAGYTASTEVPDLLGDADVDSPSEDEDDEDFNPRVGTQGAGRTEGPSSGNPNDDFFGTLGLNSSPANDPPAAFEVEGSASQAAGTQIPTSLLIQNLAQKQYEQKNQQLQPYQGQNDQAHAHDGLAEVPLNSPSYNANANVAGGKAMRSDFSIDASGIPSSSTAPNGSGTGVQAIVPQKPRITSKPDADPFGDLVDSAKKSGVL